jgi:hypothetical protein
MAAGSIKGWTPRPGQHPEQPQAAPRPPRAHTAQGQVPRQRVLRCTRDRLRPHGPQFGASDVAAAACVQVHACLRVDWANLGLAGWRPHPSGSALDSAQQAALSTFRQRWCLRGVFAEVHEGPAGPSFALALAPARYGPGAAAVPLGAAPDAAPAVVSTP